jgi:hypothetical protein
VSAVAVFIVFATKPATAAARPASASEAEVDSSDSARSSRPPLLSSSRPPSPAAVVVTPFVAVSVVFTSAPAASRPASVAGAIAGAEVDSAASIVFTSASTAAAPRPTSLAGGSSTRAASPTSYAIISGAHSSPTREGCHCQS